MRLLRLHIRNIASIERGDIDFEHGIRDAVTGAPAPLFLISGDTGAGKTVILDCISMALYRRTPRQSSVANKKQNAFATTSGEMLGVSDIEQYTRIGISAKDECYSELVFEGNDGVTYTARLELGMMRKNGGEKGQLQHRGSKWSVRRGDEAPRTGVAEVAKVILDAVGITFEQFGRMAMLAQGQFAAFLTGDKSEREAILEQLTNTEKFSRYGEAIKNIYGEAKRASDLTAHALAQLEQRRISPEERKQLEEERTEIDAHVKRLDEARAALDKEKQAIETATARRKSIAETTEKLIGLEVRLASEEYQAKQSLVSGYDATAAQRGWLTDLRRSLKEKAIEEEKIPVLREEYAMLYADLQHKVRHGVELQDALKVEQDWMKANAQELPLMEKASELAAQLSSYATHREAVAAYSATAAEEEKLTPELEEEVKAAQEAHQAAAAKADDKQKEIDKVNADLRGLNPKETAALFTAAQTRKSSISTLLAGVQELAKAHSDCDSRMKKLAADRLALEESAKEVAQAAESLKQAKATEEDAMRLHDLLEQGVEKAMVELRATLRATHAETCPLCGQHVEHLDHAEAAVREALTPAQERLAEAKRHRSEVEARYMELHSSQAKREGEAAAEERRLKAEADKLATTAKRLDSTAKPLQIPLISQLVATDYSAEAYAAIEKEMTLLLESTEKEMTTLDLRLKEAARLSEEVGRLTEEKKPLDAAQKKAQTALTEATARRDANLTKIKESKAAAEKWEKEAAAIAAGLPEILAQVYPDWAISTQTAITAIKARGEEYTAHKKRLDEVAAEGEKLTALVQLLTDIRDDVKGKFEDWNDTPEPAPLPEGSNARQRWLTLSSDCGKVTDRMRRCAEIITATSEQLSAYYEESGKDEDWLASLTNNEARVGEARRALELLKSDVMTLKAEIRRLHDELEAALAVVPVEEGEEPEKMASMTAAIADNGRERDERMARRGSITERLAQASADEEAYLKAEREHGVAKSRTDRWSIINGYFGGAKFRTLVQSYILRPLLNNANIYLSKITDRYALTCSDDNEQLSILVLDRYNKNQVRSATVLSGGERFMVSLALSLALSSLNRPDMNVDILFIDEGFGTLDEKVLDSVMATLERLQEIAGQSGRRVGVISHREELDERIPVQIRVQKYGEGRSRIEFKGVAAAEV